jgi:GATA-binding protein, other eukaryote
MTMKKPIIKRRRRVIPATQGSPSDLDDPMESIETPIYGSEGTPERGSVNPDGSVNLGLRRQPDHSLAILPDPTRSHRQSSPLPPASNLTAYHPAYLGQAHSNHESLTDDNRLAPLASFATSSGDRHSSLSPASFLSPSRKRSFSATDQESSSATEPPQDNSKRLSSIKSILNPSGDASSPPSGAEDNDYAMRIAQARSGPVDLMRDNDRSKAERRAALQREAERMREMLAAKERELAELGHD